MGNVYTWRISFAGLSVSSSNFPSSMIATELKANGKRLAETGEVGVNLQFINV